MTKRRILSSLVVISLVLSMLAVLVPTGTVLAAPSLKESHGGASSTIKDIHAGGTYPNTWAFQLFTASSSYALHSIKPFLYRTGSPGNVTVELFSVAGPADLSTHTSVTVTGIVAQTPLSTGTADTSGLGTTWQTATYLETPMEEVWLVQGQMYAFRVQALSGNDTAKLHTLFNADTKSGAYGANRHMNVIWMHNPGSGHGEKNMKFELWGEVLDTYPAATVVAPTGVTSSAATLQASVTSIGNGATSANLTFEWHYYTESSTGTITANQTITGAGTVTQNITLPVGGRQYKVKATVVNDLGKTLYTNTVYFWADIWPITLNSGLGPNRHGLITHAYQRKALYTAGRHWIFACLSATTGFFYTSSPDGETWTPWVKWRDPETRTPAHEADEFSLYYDGTYIHVAYVLNRWFESPNSNDLWYRRGLPNTDGTITWSADWQIAVPQDDGVAGYPSIVADASGHVYISYWKTASHSGEMESGNKFIHVTKNANTDGTWSTASGYPINQDYGMFAILLHLGGDNLYLVYVDVHGNDVEGKLYNGSTWGTTVDIGGGIGVYNARRLSASSWGSSIYLAWMEDPLDGGDLTFREYSYGSWQTPVTLRTDLKVETDIVLSMNGATQDVYVFWTEHDPASEYYHWIRYYSRIDGTWDAQPTNWIDESMYMLVSDRGTVGDALSQHIATYPEVYSGYLAVYYVTGTPGALSWKYTAPCALAQVDLRMAFLAIEAGPAVETDIAADITGTSATLQGELVSTGGYPTQVAFEWGLTTAYGSTTVWQSKESGQTFTGAIAGLNPNTTYYFRAIAKWGDGTTSRGTGKLFVTLSAGNPTVTTGSAVSITNSGATVQGSVTSMGDYGTVYVYFEYGLTAGYGSTTAEQTKTSTGGFSAALSGLSANTLYYFRAALRYGTTTIYGSQATFTTLAATAPTVSTGTATSITQSSGTIQGSVTSLGNYDTVYVYFQWGLTVSYEQTPTPEQAKTTTGTFSASLSGLSAGTTYYYRAVLRYDTTTIYGSQVTFTTTAASGAPGIDPPDIFRIDDVKVFSGWYEDGDHLYVINYRITYTAGDPAWDAGDYFDFVLLDGTLTRAKVPVKSWGYRPGSIYLKATAAPAWGGEYTVRIAGNPNKWTVPPTTDWVLSAGDWQGTDLAQLDAWVIALAQSMQAVYDVELVTYTDGQTHLTDQGAVVFGMGIPGLCIVRPRLCSPYAYTPPTEGEHGEIPSIDTSTRVGPEIYAAATDVATFLDIDDANVPLGLLVTIIYLAVAILLTVLLGSWGAMAGLAGFGIASPILIGGAWLGVVPWAAIIIIAAVAATYSFFAIWIKGV